MAQAGIIGDRNVVVLGELLDGFLVDYQEAGQMPPRRILPSFRLRRFFRLSPISHGGVPGCSCLKLLAKLQNLRVLFG
jgi:hypothetical protein